MALWQKISVTWKACTPWQNVGGTWKAGVLWQKIGASWQAISQLFSPAPGAYSDVNAGFATVTLTSSVPVVWTYTQNTGSGTYSSASIASGASSTSITFNCNSTGISGQIQQSASWTVVGTGAGQTGNFTVSLTATGL